MARAGMLDVSPMRLLLALAVAALATAITAPGTAAGAGEPFAGGDSAANIALPSASRWVMTRWVARHTGTLDRLYLQVKTEGSDDCPWGGRPGYARGTTGRLRATTHPVRPDGRPDTTVTLRSQELVPCEEEVRGSVALDMDLPVVEGQELATVVRNVDPAPDANYFSQNFLWTDIGLAGANGRNERDPYAHDAHYGLDPRELVGYSTDGGASWELPGGPYGGPDDAGRAFIPTYIQRYSDGTTAGQPYYWAAPVSGTVTMVYPRVPVDWTISALAAYTSTPGSAVVRLRVDGVERAAATLAGTGMLRATIAPVAVPVGATVEVTTTAGAGGLGLSAVHPDATWAGVYGLGSGHSWYLAGRPADAVPVYPLPMYAAGARLPAQPRPAPSPPSGPVPPPSSGPAPPSAPPLPATAPTTPGFPGAPGNPPAPPRPGGERGAPTTAPVRRHLVDLAKKAIVRASSTAGRGRGPRRVTDASTRSRWVAAARGGQWWQADLRTRRTLRVVSLLWGMPAPRRYRVLVSADGRRFRTIGTVHSHPGARLTARFRPRRARFVRVSILRPPAGGARVSLRDARILGPAAPRRRAQAAGAS